MDTETSAMRASQAELQSRLIAALCTRTLNQFAAESRLDGESLRDAVERYEVDYAWQVLSSARLRDDTVARVADRLQRPLSEPLQNWIADVLSAAAAAQPPELLMSFDNDVPEQFAALLCAGLHPKLDPAAAALV
ncbi:hypothetical protein [Paucibacter sp. M5-1]|uniref:hypothetical protein n=1 Tax=Paucibacter sp. M5-1 TaxID=3015998 RepID=UPI0022B86383|nr:hypothetical protein [Paucibacter sp. M5-1]MCZ7881550.1 hypothetical protein [Paucibacter sp. M5-1]